MGLDRKAPYPLPGEPPPPPPRIGEGNLKNGELSERGDGLDGVLERDGGMDA